MIATTPASSPHSPAPRGRRAVTDASTSRSAVSRRRTVHACTARTAPTATNWISVSTAAVDRSKISEVCR
ncbi:hypothetical protein RKD46_002608 [Streptomyces pseudovenezuelae]